MTPASDLVADVIAAVGTRAEAEALADVGSTALTRFANSFIHQNVSEDVSTVSLRLALDGRIASATSTVTTPDDVHRLVTSALQLASLQPVDPDWPGVGEAVEQPVVDHWDEATAAADPVARAETVRRFVDAGEGLSAAGYCETAAHSTAYLNTRGRTGSGRYTTATLDGIQQTESSAGSGHASGVALGSIDAGAIGAQASGRAEQSRGAFDAKPGDYEVVLSPECVATMTIFLSFYGFNGKAAEEGLSFVELGERRFDPAIQLWDDATDPRALHLGFDAEGTPKRHLGLIESGVTTHLLHNRRTAAKAGTTSTGHAASGADAFGAFATNLFVGEGAETVEDLVSGVERGIYVSTFNYCRVLDPKSLVVTGLTRNGTFMIENGRITDPVTNLRFTQSFIDAWADGSVLGIGGDARFADSEFGPSLVHAPSMRLASWRFTGGAEG
ncbi:MAG: metallopeptidase TldD-related protein [Acidimicrobiia bacterium]|nr:metallopeptidase TldD-related protein [Acidimicrobiia bacterium]